MAARKNAPARKTGLAGEPGPELAMPADTGRVVSAAPAPTAAERGWCRIGRDLDDNAPECPRHELDPGAGLCNLHFVTRLDLREVARNDG